jgi:BirA family biotin operon repressor/biotin-[acetyl-CoA-carboxylase] ligase
MHITVLNFDTLDSTNTEALKQAKLGAAEGLCVIARQQTAGRGRHGRTWISPKDSGLYLSIVLRPTIETKFLPLLTLTAGIAVHDTLSDLGIQPDIKWVNDVLVDERKICGILAETTDSNDGVAVIVGIGINLLSQAVSPELNGLATSVEEVTGRALTAADLAPILTAKLTNWHDILSKPEGPAAIIEAWRDRSSYFSGKRVRVVLENETIFGVTDGLEPDGALRLKRDDGNLAVIHAGDVEQLRSTT